MGGFMPTQGVMSDVTPAGPGPKTGFWIRPIWAWIAWVSRRRLFERCCLEQLSCAENNQWQYMMVRKRSSNQILHGSFVDIHGTNGHLLECRSWIIHWLVVWNMNFMFPFSWEFHNPNWQTYIFRRGRFSTNQYIWQCEIPNCSCLIFDFLFLFCCDFLVFFCLRHVAGKKDTWKLRWSSKSPVFATTLGSFFSWLMWDPPNAIMAIMCTDII